MPGAGIWELGWSPGLGSRKRVKSGRKRAGEEPLSTEGATQEKAGGLGTFLGCGEPDSVDVNFGFRLRYLLHLQGNRRAWGQQQPLQVSPLGDIAPVPSRCRRSQSSRTKGPVALGLGMMKAGPGARQHGP